MGKETGIAWTTHTYNPWWGCMKVSPGCTNCYAESWDHRTGGGHWGPLAPRRFFSDKHWREPERWNKAALEAGERRRVFCASMADVFEDRPDLVAPRARLFDLIQRTPGLDWLLLTKRPQNLLAMLPWMAGIATDSPRAVTGELVAASKPWPNVWLGTTAEDQERADERIAHLVSVPAVVRFLSCEPLLSPLALQGDFTMLRSPLGGEVIHHKSYLRGPAGDVRVDWVIAGCESGQDKRPASASWFQGLRDQCARAGVAYFLKQAMTEHGPAVYPGTGAFRPELVTIGTGSSVKRDQVVEAPYLDGRQHLEVPKPRMEVAA